MRNNAANDTALSETEDLTHKPGYDLYREAGDFNADITEARGPQWPPNCSGTPLLATNRLLIRTIYCTATIQIVGKMLIYCRGPRWLPNPDWT